MKYASIDAKYDYVKLLNQAEAKRVNRVRDLPKKIERNVVKV